MKLEEKYIDLLLNRCVDQKRSKILFIHYSKEIQDFIKRLITKAKRVGFEEFYLEEEDIYEIHDFLKDSSMEEIKNSSYFDKSIWDTYAAKQACFLIFETEYPGLMEDIAPEKIALSSHRRRNSRPLYRKLVENCDLSWCIAAYPGKRWAEDIFPKSNQAYQKLEQAIYQICMVDQKDPISSWDKLLKKNSTIIEKLNQLELEKLHYTNAMGTDLIVYLPEKYQFSSAKDGNVIVNMPSYEVFASPVYQKTEGIVYSSKPLIYNGAFIDKFFLRFKEGRVIDFDAQVGKEVLGQIINIDSNSCYLGECALVEYNSPISNLNLVFGTTLIDENASCHLALGAGFPECVEEGIGLSEEELLAKGINVSKGHVDFMIGTSDLNILGVTKSGEDILIFKDGNFNSKLFQND